MVKAPPRFHSWGRRGMEFEGLSSDAAQCLLRCSPEDGHNGFFVAQFERNTSEVASVISSDLSGRAPGNMAISLDVPLTTRGHRISKRSRGDMPSWKHYSKRLKY